MGNVTNRIHPPTHRTTIAAPAGNATNRIHPPTHRATIAAAAGNVTGVTIPHRFPG